MNRILVIGCPGSGKSVFSRKLAEITRLPLIHLDTAYHKDIWPADAALKREQWREHVSGLVKEDRWIIDGNYKSTFDIRMPAADTIIFLDYPRWLALFRVFKRRFEFHNKRRSDMPENWKEKVSWDFLQFVWSYRKIERPRVLLLLEQYSSGRDIFIVNHSGEAERIVAKIMESISSPYDD